ncbi:hypothetical protein TNCV_2524271 [Trichonephila clavipes]|nr:hypothetical protein TNCV_2524271 [Trichonephila clavipes]
MVNSVFGETQVSIGGQVSGEYGRYSFPSLCLLNGESFHYPPPRLAVLMKESGVVQTLLFNPYLLASQQGQLHEGDHANTSPLCHIDFELYFGTLFQQKSQYICPKKYSRTP